MPGPEEYTHGELYYLLHVKQDIDTYWLNGLNDYGDGNIDTTMLQDLTEGD